jgi:hypothetical protein
MKRGFAAIVAILALTVLAHAERPPQSREQAKLVISGTVKKLATDTKVFGGDGVHTDYTAEVVVDAVDKGDAVKTGDTIKVTWFHVTKRPTKPFPGAYGHAYDLKEKDKAKFWLIDRAPGTSKVMWEVIYNKDGVEKIK